MPRKISQLSPTQPTTSLALSSVHIRIETLDKERQWLLKQIKRKRTELNNFVEQMRSLATDILQQCAVSFQKLADIDQEIHALFAEIFASRKFNKQTQKDIEGIYRTLQLAGVITPKPVGQHEDITGDEQDEDDQQEHNYHRASPEADEPYEKTQTPLGFSPRNKNDVSRNIRQTFLNLAAIFHPDKVKDGETQMRYTEIMKEINKAYQEGDLARLLEIERQHDIGKFIDSNSEDDLSRKCTRLEQENELLRSQYVNLKQELALVKKTPEGAMVADCRKAKKVGVDAISLMVKQVESEIEIIASIRDFVQDFHERKMTIKEFLCGPPALRRMHQAMAEDLLERLFIDLDEMG
jgi:hypothetical protein